MGQFGQIGAGAALSITVVLALISGSNVSPMSKFKKAMSKALISRNPGHLQFFLYPDPQGMREYMPLDFGHFDFVDKNTTSAVFQPGKPLKVILHGFMGDFKTNSVQQIKNAYLKQYGNGSTIILVDWARLATPRIPIIDVFLYKIVVANVPIVGHRVAEFLAHLTYHKLVRPEDIHIIGFSIGAHVAGNVGMHFKQAIGKRLARITGLDPARLNPFHAESKSKYKHLNFSDADFVDVVHTGFARLAVKQTMGHADFYVNGGARQPQCEDTVNLDDDFLELFSSLTETIAGSCSHFKAAEYFANSINSPVNITACACESWAEYKSGCGTKCERPALFGEKCSKDTRGVYYLEIKRKLTEGAYLLA